MSANREPVFESLSTILKRAKVLISKRTDKAEFPFGIKSLDAITHGIKRGKLTLVAGRTSEGKSAFCLQTAVSLADAGKTVAFISLEDDVEQIAEKIFCNMGRVENWKLIKGDTSRLNDPAINTLFDDLKLLVMDNFGYSFDEVRRVVEELEPKPDIVFLDYIQIIDRMEKMNRYESLSEFARQCKIFAEQSDIGFVIASQINRAGARDARPALHHLSGCDALEQTADLVLLLYYPFVYGSPSYNYKQGTMEGFEVAPRNWIEVEVAKNKTGQRGVIVPLCFTGQHYLFEDWVVLP